MAPGPVGVELVGRLEALAAMFTDAGLPFSLAERPVVVQRRRGGKRLPTFCAGETSLLSVFSVEVRVKMV
jgi:hypothetical protein